MGVVKLKLASQAAATQAGDGAPARAAALVQQLQDSEARFRTLSALSADGYWEQDPAHRYTRMDGGNLARAGLDAARFVGLAPWDGAAAPLGDGGSWANHKACLRKRQPFADFVFKRLNAAGELRYLSASGEPVFDEDGLFRGYRGTVRDVSSQVRMGLRLAVEHAVTRVLAESSSVTQAAPRILQVICETLGWSCGSRKEILNLADPPRCTETWGIADARIRAFLRATRRELPRPQAGGLSRRARLEGKPQWILDVTQEPSFRRRAQAAKAGLRSAFAFPILLGSQVVSVLEFFSRELRPPDPELLDCMSYVCSQIGQFMQRERAEEAQRRFRAAIDVSADLVLLVDPRSMLYIDANDTACKVLGHRREELLALGPQQHADATREELLAQYERLIAGEPGTAGVLGSYRRRDGSRLTVESSTHAVPSAGGHVIVTVARDVSRRQRKQELVDLEHAVTRGLSEADSVAAALRCVIRTMCESEHWDCGRYFQVDEQAKLLRFAGAAGGSADVVTRLIEKSRDVTYTRGAGLIGRAWESGQPIWSEDIAGDPRLLKGVARELGMHGSLMFPAVADGKVVGVLAFHSREFRAPEERFLDSLSVLGIQIGQFVQRKQAEVVLRESEERFRAVVDSANEGILVYDRALRVIAGNAAAARIIGLPLEVLMGADGFTSLLPCVREDGSPLQPEDRPTRLTVTTGSPLDGRILGIKRPDGSLTWLSVNTGFLRRPGEADYYGVVSTLGDISLQRQAEAALRESEGRLRSLNELSSDWFWEQDAELRFTRLEGRHVTGNRAAFQHDLGRTSEEIGVEVEGGWPAHHELLARQLPFRDVVMRRTYEDGMLHYMSVSGEPIFDTTGQFLGYRGVGADITERKRAEQLRALEHAVNRSLNEADHAADALQRVISQICRTEGWECGRYLQVDTAAGLLRFGESWSAGGADIEHYLEHSRSMVYAFGQALAGRVWQSGEPLWVQDIGTDARAARAQRARDTGLHGAFAVPVASEGQTLGVLIFHSRRIRQPDERLLQATRVIGSQLGQFLQRKNSQQATLRLGRMFAALSETNDAILHAQSPDDLYQRVCEAAVHGGKFSNTSVFLADPGELRARAVAGAGRAAQRLRESLISFDDSIVEGQGLVGQAFRSCKPQVSNDFLHDERTRPWHGIARELGCRSAAALPLVKDGRAIGAVLIYDDEPGAFDTEILRLLERLAENVSYALDNFERESERRRAARHIEYLANHDGLTGLPNRIAFSQALEDAIASARRHERHFAVLFIDLDRFKIINDTLGHAAGDLLLQEMSRRIKDNLRTSDFVARLGGDEFVVLAQELGESDQVAIVARKLLSMLMQPVMILGQECRVTASIGISMFPTDAQDEQSLMKNADVAMYVAKEAGKNHFQFYSKDIESQSLDRLTLEASLRQALDREEFFLHYQPKLELSSGRITGVEALLRWQHPTRGLVSPAQFIPLAEETGLIVAIGRWVLKAACLQNVAWQRDGLAPVCMAVNLSPRQFADENWLSYLAEVLQDTGMAPALLELEITESMVMGNVERAARQLCAIKAMGVQLSIDDFGTGYSSLAQLKRFPIDTLKIDRSFIRAIPHDAEDVAITRAIIAMAKALGLTVIAEGVETVEQESFLRQNGCDQTQGFYFSRPVPPQRLAELLLDTPRH